MVSLELDGKYCQIVIKSNGKERILEPCSTRIDAEAFIATYNASRARGDSVAEIRDLDLSCFPGYADS